MPDRQEIRERGESTAEAGVGLTSGYLRKITGTALSIIEPSIIEQSRQKAEGSHLLPPSALCLLNHL
jgi:hypothetical protein